MPERKYVCIECGAFPKSVMGRRRPLSIAEVHHSRQSHERDPGDENTQISLVRWLYSSHQHHSATTEIEGVVCVVVLVVRNATTNRLHGGFPRGSTTSAQVAIHPRSNRVSLSIFDIAVCWDSALPSTFWRWALVSPPWFLTNWSLCQFLPENRGGQAGFESAIVGH